ncbi:MAG: polysaccharide biosynthesis protein [Selenomonadales bacterium]|nr:polysaccharide biosynthesis protein [Selenomonadales bacterium]
MSLLWKYKLLLALSDVVALAASGLAGLLLRFDGYLPPIFYGTWLRYLLLVAPVYLVVYYSFGLYSRIWRYASVRDLLSIVLAVGLATTSLFVVFYAVPNMGFPRSVFVMQFFLNVAAVGGTRFGIRVVDNLTRRSGRAPGRQKVLVIGAGDAGRSLVEEIAKHPELDYSIIGFLDDDPAKSGMQLAGIRILGRVSLLEQVATEQGIEHVIIAMPSAPAVLVRDITLRCRKLNIMPKTVPSLHRLLRDSFKMNEVRDVQIEDILPRPEVKMNGDTINSYIRGKRVLITGAGGSIGSELSRQIARLNPEHLLLLGRGENSIFEIHRELTGAYQLLPITPLIADIRDAVRINAVFTGYEPHVVFHAAAYKHVPLMESHPAEALQNNVLGTNNVALAALHHHTERFVLISSDKAVNPSGVMGASKRLAEVLLQGLNNNGPSTKFMSVRFGNVLGSRGSVIPIFKEQIAKGGPVTVTHPDMMRYFMTIPEAVSLVIQAGAMGNGGEVFVLDMGRPVKVLDLALDLINLSGLRPYQDIPIVFSGLRPGEKLVEEIHTGAEGLHPTKNPHIFVTSPPFVDQDTWRNVSTATKTLSQRCTSEELMEFARSVEALLLTQAAATLERLLP